jgi:hypothetical protein
MRRLAIPAILLLFLLALGPGCILEEKVIEVVVSAETCAEFEEDEDSENFTTPVTIDYAEEIEDILADNGISRSDIMRAKLMKASYEVTSFSHTHDWVISGEITVERTDDPEGPATLVEYTSQSLEAALGVETPAALDPAGVTLINDALDDFVNGDDDVTLIFAVNNGDVGPTSPSPADRLVFTWRACVVVHVLVAEELEVPDPL